MEQSKEIAVIDKSLPLLNNTKEILLANDFTLQKVKSSYDHLISEIKKNGGKLNAQLDETCMKFITKCNQRKQELEGARKPITVVMDTLKKMFTGIEAEIDFTNKGSMPAQLQQYRNEYALQLKREAEEKKKEIERQNNVIKERGQIKADIELQLRNYVHDAVAEKKKKITEFFNGATLEDLDKRCEVIQEKDLNWPKEDGYPSFKYSGRPIYLNQAEVEHTVQNVCLELHGLKMAHDAELDVFRKDLLDTKESKRAALNEIAEADAERKKKLLEEEAERIRKQQEEQQRQLENQKKDNAQVSELAKSEAHTLSLFNTHSQAAELNQSSAGGTREKLIIKVNHAGAWPMMFELFFKQEGVSLSAEEMEKKTMKQIKAFCESLANKKVGAIKIQSDFLSYELEVKSINKTEKVKL